MATEPAAADPTPPLVLDVRDVAERLRISRSFAYELIAAGRLPSIRLGRRVLVPATKLDEFIDGEAGPLTS
jgi:excisionase family DNA binding protein